MMNSNQLRITPHGFNVDDQQASGIDGRPLSSQHSYEDGAALLYLLGAGGAPGGVGCTSPGINDNDPSQRSGCAEAAAGMDSLGAGGAPDGVGVPREAATDIENLMKEPLTSPGIGSPSGVGVAPCGSTPITKNLSCGASQGHLEPNHFPRIPQPQFQPGHDGPQGQPDRYHHQNQAQVPCPPNYHQHQLQHQYLQNKYLLNNPNHPQHLHQQQQQQHHLNNSSQPPTHIHPQSIDTMSARSDITSLSSGTNHGSSYKHAPSRMSGMVTPQGAGAPHTPGAIEGHAARAAQQTPAGSVFDSSATTNTRMGNASSSSTVQNIIHVQHDFLPQVRREINEDWARRMWEYAHHFSRVLPEKNPNDTHVEKYTVLLKLIWDDVRNQLVHFLLEYLENLATTDDIAYKKDPDQEKRIESIHSAVIDTWDPNKSRDDVQNWRDYLGKVMTYIRLPQKEEVSWRKFATLAVEKKWKIRFEYAARTKNCVHAIAMKMFNDCHKQRQRRGTVKNANIAFYDRKPFKKETVFGENTETHSFRVTFILRSHTVRGHIVFAVTPERKALVKKIAADCGPNNNSNPAKEVKHSSSQRSQPAKAHTTLTTKGVEDSIRRRPHHQQGPPQLLQYHHEHHRQQVQKQHPQFHHQEQHQQQAQQQQPQVQGRQQ